MSTKDSYASIASNNVANSPSMTENSVSTPTFGASSIPNPLESTPTPANITGTSSAANANGTASSAATGADPNVNDSSYLLSPSVLSTHNNHGSRNLLAGGSVVGAASEVNNLSGVLMGLSLDPNTSATQDSNNDHNANGTKSIFSSHFYNGDNSSPVVVPSTPPPQNQSQIQNGSQKNIDQTANNTQQQQQDQKFTSVFSSTQPGTPNWASSKNDPQKSQQQQGSQSNTTSGSFLPDITMATTPQQPNAQQFLPMGSQNFISLTPNPFNSQMGNNQSTPFSSKIEVPSTAPPVPVGRSSSLGIVGGGSTMRPFVLPESVQVQQQNGGANSNSDSGSNSANSSVVLNANNITGATTLAGDESSPANTDEKVSGSSSTGSASGKISSSTTTATNSASNSKSDPANKDTTGSFGPLLNNNKDGRSSYSNGSPNQLHQQIGNEFDQSIHSMNQGLAPNFFNNTGSMSMGGAGGVNAPFPVSAFNSFIPNRSQGLQQQLSSASLASANSSNDASANGGSVPPFAMGYQNGGVIPGLESTVGVADSFNGLGGANSFGQLPNANSLLQGNAMYNQQLPPLGATFNPVTGNPMSDYYAAQQMQHAMNLGNPQNNLLSQQDPQQQQHQQQQQQQQHQGQQQQPPQHFGQMPPHGLQGQQMHLPSMAAAQQLQQQHLARGNLGLNSTANVHRKHNSNKRRGEDASRFVNASLNDFINEIYFLCKDQHGCRFLQRQLEIGGFEAATKIFNEIQLNVIELMIDPFGNYLIQKLLERVNEEQRTTLVRNASSQFVRIALDPHGTRALQKLVECVSTETEFQIIISSLSSYIVLLSRDLNGNHVVQKCLQKLPSDRCDFIFDAACENCVKIAKHRHGCCVLQRCFDHGSPQQCERLSLCVGENCVELSVDPYGNYVVQYVLSMEENRLRTASDPTANGKVPNTERAIQLVLNVLTKGLPNLSTHKFGSNVIEKSLRIPTLAPVLIQSLLDQPNNLTALLHDAYGNYVLQTALDVADDNNFRELSECLKPGLNDVRNTPHGRRILGRLISRGGSSVQFGAGATGATGAASTTATSGNSTTAATASPSNSSSSLSASATPSEQGSNSRNMSNTSTSTQPSSGGASAMMNSQQLNTPMSSISGYQY